MSETVVERAGEPFGRVPASLFRDAPSGALRLYGWLSARYMNWRTGECWPSRNRLARDLGVNVKTIDRAIEDLRDFGVLVVKPRRGANGGVATNCLVLLGIGRAVARPATSDRGFSDPGPLDKIVPSDEAEPLDKIVQYPAIRETKLSPKRENVELESKEREGAASAAVSKAKGKEPKPTEDEQRVFDAWRESIHPEARMFPVRKIRARLQRWSVDELLVAIERFAGNAWRMEHNASKAADWFFGSDTLIEEFLALRQDRYSGRVSPAGIAPGLSRYGQADLPPNSPQIATFPIPDEFARAVRL